MNLRRSIRFSVSAIVWLLSLTSIGVVLWVADEGFGWDLFPDWLENCATVLLASVGLLTAFAVVSCLSASAALAALAVADRAGTEPDRAPSKVRRWAVRGVFAAIALAVATGVVLQKVDDWRAEKREAERREAHARDFEATRASLAQDAAAFAAKFDSGLALAAASGDPDRTGDVADLLGSFSASSQLSPSVWLVVRAEPPYAWCKIWENPDARKRREPRLDRAPLVDLPSVWERDTVRALFDGAELEVPFGRSGAVIDTRDPCAWAAVKAPDGTVAALLVLRTHVRYGWSRR